MAYMIKGGIIIKERIINNIKSIYYNNTLELIFSIIFIVIGVIFYYTKRFIYTPLFFLALCFFILHLFNKRPINTFFAITSSIFTNKKRVNQRSIINTKGACPLKKLILECKDMSNSFDYGVEYIAFTHKLVIDRLEQAGCFDVYKKFVKKKSLKKEKKLLKNTLCKKCTRFCPLHNHAKVEFYLVNFMKK